MNRNALFGAILLPATLFASAVLASGRMEVVGPASVDLGRFRAWKKQSARYTVRNAGGGVLEIRSVKAACACAETSSSLQQLKKGQEAVIEVTIIPNSIFGRFRKTVYVESSDTEKRFTNLTVAGEAVPIVTVSPQRYVNAGHIETNTPWSQSFDLTSNVPELRLGEPNAESSHTVRVTMEHAPKKAGDYRLDLSLAPTGKSGDLRCLVRVPVLAPAGHPGVELTVLAAIGMSLKAFPSTIVLPVSDQPHVRTVKLRLPPNSRLKLDPARVTAPQVQGMRLDIAPEKGTQGLLVKATFDRRFMDLLMAVDEIGVTFGLPGAASAEVKIKVAAP